MSDDQQSDELAQPVEDTRDPVTWLEDDFTYRYEAMLRRRTGDA